MAQQTAADETRTAVRTPDDENAQVEVAFRAGSDVATDHGAVERTGKVADHPKATDEYRVKGHVATRYSDEKYLVETELGYQIVVNGDTREVRDFETGEVLGEASFQVATSEDDLPEDTEDWDSDDWAQVNQHPSENNHYVSTTGNITRHCPRCGYEGTHDHPRRSAPTFHADLTHHCPDAECGARLHSGPAAECEDCDHEDDEDDDQEQEVATDGGQPMEDALAASSHDSAPDAPQEQAEQENPHQHTSVWAAAQNLQTHEDGSAPRVGVEYRKKNGNGTARKAGTVERVEVERPDEQPFGREVGQPVPRIVFTRDDGQRMYVEPDGLYTVGSHAPYVGATVALTTSTTSTVDVPEVEAREDDGEDSSDDSPQVRVPDVDSLEGLAEWVEAQGSDLHAEVGSTHYSWDIPGFGRQNDPHSGRTAVRNGNECAFVEVRGPRSDRVEQALAELAHREDLEVSASSHRATLVPPQGW